MDDPLWIDPKDCRKVTRKFIISHWQPVIFYIPGWYGKAIFNKRWYYIDLLQISVNEWSFACSRGSNHFLLILRKQIRRAVHLRSINLWRLGVKNRKFWASELFEWFLGKKLLSVIKIQRQFLKSLCKSC